MTPYDRDAVPGSILEIEDDNFDPDTKQQRQIYCLAISAKRYTLFVRRKRKSRPASQGQQQRKSHVWLNVICESLKLPIEKLDFEDLPAVGRVSIGSPGALRPLGDLNLGKKYRDQIKPFSFLLTCHVKQLGHPIDSDPERFHLIAPYQSNPKKWLSMEWIDQYTGKRYGITTTGYPNECRALVKTYGDVLREYEFHPESKCANTEGEPCDKQTIGLLKRLHLRILNTTHIGKKSNKIEDVASALVHSAQEVYTEYPDPRRDGWESTIRPALNKVSPETIAEKTGLSVRTIIYARTGQKRPLAKNQERIAVAVQE